MPKTLRQRLISAASVAVLTGTVLVSGAPAWAVETSVIGVRVGEHEGFSRIVLDMTDGKDFKYKFSENYRQLIVDLDGLEWRAPDSKNYPKSQFIEQYRVEDGMLIVETSRPIMVAVVENLRPDQSGGHRLYFDLARAPESLVADPRYVSDDAALPTETAANESAPQPAPMPEPEPVAPVEVTADTEPGTVVVTADTAPVGPADEQQAMATEDAPAQGRAAQWYVRLDGGYALGGNAGIKQSTMTGEMDNIGDSAVANLGLGYQFEGGFRTDLTASHVGWHKLDDKNAGTTYTADIGSTQVMINGYIDMIPDGDISPYLGAGVGAAYNSMGDVTASTGTTVKGKDGTVVAYQLMAGAGFKVGDNTTIDLGYRYLNAGKLETESKTSTGAATSKFEGELVDHQILLGARFGF